jgi:purine-binding chemotaxis protein CheW
MNDDDSIDQASRTTRTREDEGERTDAGGSRGDGSGDRDGGRSDGELEMEWGNPGGSTGSTAGGTNSDETGGVDDDGTEDPLQGADGLGEAVGGAGADAGSAAGTITPEEIDTVEGSGPEDEDGETTRVLEFTLHDEHYCLDIEYIEEIVREEAITRVPNTAEVVEGVVDLRGQITTILNPKVTIGKPETGAGGLIVVFDSDAFDDQGHVGWVVDDVRQVSLVSHSAVNDAPVEDDHINGVIDREGQDDFLVWTTPGLAFDGAG